MIVIATPSIGDVAPQWYSAFDRLEKPMRSDGGRDWVRVTSQRLIVQQARNTLVRAMLEPDASPEVSGLAGSDARAALAEASHLFFLDDDIYPPADALTRLLARDAPIVSGFYVGRVHPHLPVAYRHVPATGAYVPMCAFASGLQEVDAVGAGCLLVRREVFARMPAPWFDFIQERAGVRGLSEDLYFCQKAAALGLGPILLDFDVQCLHAARHLVGLAGCVEAQQDRTACYGSEDEARLAQEIRPWPPDKKS